MDVDSSQQFGDHGMSLFYCSSAGIVRSKAIPDIDVCLRSTSIYGSDRFPVQGMYKIPLPGKEESLDRIHLWRHTSKGRRCRRCRSFSFCGLLNDAGSFWTTQRRMAG
jgi:hypothetical protein